MSLRLPTFGRAARETGLDVLAAELAGESAAALGGAGRKLENALAELRAAADPRDPQLVRAAADAALAYFVTREACGAIRQDEAIRHFGIPGYVLARVGAR